MLRVQVLLFLSCIIVAAEPMVGEAGLGELFVARARVQVVSGTGFMTVVRAEEPDEKGTRWRTRFAAAADGRYDVILTDAADPTGERQRYLCVGDETWECVWMSVDDQQPQIRTRRASDDMFASLMACIRLDPASLRADYTIELLAAEAGSRILKLVPTRAAILREITWISITLDATGRPVHLAVLESSGNLRRLDFDTFSDDPQLEPGWFVPPKR